MTQMSRRGDRESDSRRHSSRFDREPSPKRSRRDGTRASEKSPKSYSRAGGGSKQDKEHYNRLRDAIPKESALAPDSKTEGGSSGKESEKKIDGRNGGQNHSSDPTEVPRSKSFFEHDERGNARQVGRSFGRGPTSERGWRDSKDQQHDGSSDKKTVPSTQRKDEKKRDADGVWRHDGFFEMQDDPPPPARKRPAFREKKIPFESENVVEAATQPPETNKSSNRPPDDGRGRREERGRNPRVDRPDGEGADRAPTRREPQRGSYAARERFSSWSSGYRGRDRFNGKPGYRSGGVRVEKWKHDMFHEANRSPTPKNEEDQMAKLEALLAS